MNGLIIIFASLGGFVLLMIFIAMFKSKDSNL